MFKNNYKPSKIEKRLFTATLWNLIGNGVARVIMVVALIFVARILGPEEFGKWGVIRTTISMFTLFISFSLSVTTIKHLAQYRKESKEKAGKILSLAFLLALIFGSFVTFNIFIFSETIAIKLLNDITIATPLKIATFFIVLMAVNSVLTGALSGLENFKFIAISNFIAGIVAAPIIILLTNYFALNGITMGYVFYYLVLFSCLFFFLSKELKNNDIKFVMRDLRSESSVFNKFSLPALVSGSIGGPAVFIVYIFVADLKGGFIMIGLFSAAKIFQMAILELGSQLQNPLISLLSNEKDSKEIFSLSFTVPLLFITICALPIIYIPELVAWVFNKGGYNIEEFTLVISLTLLTGSIMLFKQGLNRMIITNNLLWWGVYENLFWSVLLISLVWLLAPVYGATGLAISFTLAYFIDLLVIMPFYYSKKLIPKSLFFSWDVIAFGLIFILGCLSVYLEFDIYIRFILLIVSFLAMYLIISKLNRKLKN